MKFISTLIFLLFGFAAIAQDQLAEVVVVADNSKPQNRQTITKEIRQSGATGLEFPVKKKPLLKFQIGCYLCCAPARPKDTARTLAFRLPEFNLAPVKPRTGPL